jgi:hypothetical protein
VPPPIPLDALIVGGLVTSHATTSRFVALARELDFCAPLTARTAGAHSKNGERLQASLSANRADAIHERGSALARHHFGYYSSRPGSTSTTTDEVEPHRLRSFSWSRGASTPCGPARTASLPHPPGGASDTVEPMSLQKRVDELESRQGSPAEEHLIYARIAEYEVHGTENPGINSTYYVRLEGGAEGFHKPFAGVDVPAAQYYGHHPDEVPLHECAAWRLALRLGGPYSELVAPCVLRDHEGEVGALSARQYGLPLSGEPFQQVPDACFAAAFFDSLIAQQDRHRGNYRWDPDAPKLGLIDHGFAFAKPGQFFNKSVFVVWRWEQGAAELTDGERVLLRGLLDSGDLYGLAWFLLPEEADALAARARRMLEQGTILGPGEF